MSLRKVAGALALLALIFVIGGGATDTLARTTPWDCSDWQAFAHDDRTTAILESLAENRGKTLYCGIDQSDTFGKAETWEAGKDRNERDDTVYWGEGGSFRGFIAAQEGWLTDGESGITGQSIAVIFEFPKEEKRTKRVKRLAVSSGPVATDTCPDPHPQEAGNPQPGTLACSGWGGRSALVQWNQGEAKKQARAYAAGIPGTQNDYLINWQTQVYVGKGTQWNRPHGIARPNSAEWRDLAKTVARRVCREQGYPRATNVVIGPGHNREPGHSNMNHADWVGADLGWFFAETDGHSNPSVHAFIGRQSRTWTATCKKVIRRNR